jgi:ethanolamine utilization protein EutQ (cupin superfamily)
MDCVVAPVDQILLVAEEDVKVTVPLGHKMIGPAGEIVGVPKEAEMVTVIELDTKAGQPPTVLVAV